MSVHTTTSFNNVINGSTSEEDQTQAATSQHDVGVRPVSVGESEKPTVEQKVSKLNEAVKENTKLTKKQIKMRVISAVILCLGVTVGICTGALGGALALLGVYFTFKAVPALILMLFIPAYLAIAIIISGSAYGGFLATSFPLNLLAGDPNGKIKVFDDEKKEWNDFTTYMQKNKEAFETILENQELSDDVTLNSIRVLKNLTEIEKIKTEQKPISESINRARTFLSSNYHLKSNQLDNIQQTPKPKGELNTIRACLNSEQNSLQKLKNSYTNSNDPDSEKARKNDIIALVDKYFNDKYLSNIGLVELDGILLQIYKLQMEHKSLLEKEAEVEKLREEIKSLLPQEG